MSPWLDERGLTVGDLTGRTADEFLGDRRTAGYTLWLSTKALVPLVDHLGGLGVLPAREAPVRSPSDVLLDDYCAYLVGECGLADGTARNYAWHLRSFLSERTVSDHVELEQVTAADLRSFLLAARAERSVGTAELVVTALRSFLGWCTSLSTLGWGSPSPGVRLAARRRAVRRRISRKLFRFIET